MNDQMHHRTMLYLGHCVCTGDLEFDAGDYCGSRKCIASLHRSENLLILFQLDALQA